MDIPGTCIKKDWPHILQGVETAFVVSFTKWFTLIWINVFFPHIFYLKLFYFAETFMEVPQISTTSINVESKTVVITAKLWQIYDSLWQSPLWLTFCDKVNP